MQEYNEQINATTDAATAEHPAGEMVLPKSSKIGARARALSGLAFGVAVGVGVIANVADTTIHPGVLG